MCARKRETNSIFQFAYVPQRVRIVCSGSSGGSKEDIRFVYKDLVIFNKEYTVFCAYSKLDTNRQRDIDTERQRNKQNRQTDRKIKR